MNICWKQVIAEGTIIKVDSIEDLIACVEHLCCVVSGVLVFSYHHISH